MQANGFNINSSLGLPNNNLPHSETLNRNLFSNELIEFERAHHEELKTLYNELSEEERNDLNFQEFAFEVYSES